MMDTETQPPDETQVIDSYAEVTATVFETISQVWADFLQHLPLLFCGLIVIFITAFLGSLVQRFAPYLFRFGHLRKSLRDLFTRLIFIGVWVLGLLLASLVIFPGVTPASALGGLGIVSLAVGFAFRDIFENFFAGILILWRFPFENGDFIECEGISGSVEDISIRMTLIRKTTGELVILPNSFLFTNPVRVLTNLDSRRVEIIAGVAYGENVEEACSVIKGAVANCTTVNQAKPVQVFPQGFGSSSIDIEVAWWTDPKPVDIRKSRGEVVTAIKSALDNAGIEIPFPYRTLTFKEPLPIHRSEKDESAEQE